MVALFQIDTNKPRGFSSYRKNKKPFEHFSKLISALIVHSKLHIKTLNVSSGEASLLCTRKSQSPGGRVVRES